MITRYLQFIRNSQTSITTERTRLKTQKRKLLRIELPTSNEECSNHKLITRVHNTNHRQMFTKGLSNSKKCQIGILEILSMRSSRSIALSSRWPTLVKDDLGKVRDLILEQVLELVQELEEVIQEEDLGLEDPAQTLLLLDKDLDQQCRLNQRQLGMILVPELLKIIPLILSEELHHKMLSQETNL